MCLKLDIKKSSVIKCDYCKSDFNIKKKLLKSNKKNGYNCYCSKDCQKKGRTKSVEEKKEKRKIYDLNYRKNNSKKIKNKKQEYYKEIKNSDSQSFKEQRIKRKIYQKEYIKTKTYKNWKNEYSKKTRCKNRFGEFWESAVIVKDIAILLKSKQTNINNKNK